MEMQPRGQLGTGLAHRASRRAPSIEGSSHSDVIPAGTSSGIRSCTVAGPSTAGHVRIVAVSCHRDAAEGRRHEYSPAIASASIPSPG